jgi:alcohol dehydrogenase class IV
LLINLPEKVRNSTVLDAIAQAVESMWAKNADENSRRFSEEALKKLLSGLKADSKEQKLKLFQKGSFFAGKAINISKTTASHAISYPLSAHFGIPHGVAVFLTLPPITRYNFFNSDTDCFPKLFKLFGVSGIDELENNIKKIMSDMGFSLKLNDYGIKNENISMIASESIVPGRSDNNPADLSSDLVSQLLLEII